MAESFGGLVELVRSFDYRLHPSRRQQWQDGGPGGRFDRSRLREQGEAAHARALPDQVRDIDRRRAPSRVSQRGQNATEGKRGERVTRQGTAHAVDDDIRSAASRQASDALSETLRGEIDDVVETQGPCLLGFGRVGRRRNNSRRALSASQLGDGVTDRAADGRRQDGLTWPEARLRERNL